MTERILVVEDESILRRNLCEFLSAQGFEVVGAEDGETALKRVREEDYDLLLSDIRLPRLDGLSLLQRVVEERPDTLVIMMTAYGSTESAVESLRCGAFDYLQKPIDYDDLVERIRHLVEHRSLQREVGRLRRAVAERLGFSGIVGTSPPIRAVTELVSKVAPTPATVLITGESGTGKELVARAVHDRSDRADREFLAVNMAALPESLLEAQLFGHERGAFTGAERRREGILRSARGGTVFLDEIGEMPPTAQSRLLRAIEQREVLPVGADRPVPVDFRLVAATNRDLAAEVEAGRFRRDLLYRLDVFRVELPPLRDRPSDVPALVEHFGALHARSLGAVWRGTTNAAMRQLCQAAWPGNVRELANVVERAIILAGARPIDTVDLPRPAVDAEEHPAPLKEAVAAFERRHIAGVLAGVEGNRDEAARRLGIDRATLYRRLERLGLK